MKKTLLRILVLALLTLSMVAGCSQKASDPAPAEPSPQEAAPEPTEEPVTITWMNFSANEDRAALLDQIVQAFEATHPGIKVSVQTQSWEDYFTKLPTMIAGGSPPDAFELNYENFVDYAGKGVLLDLGPLAAADPSFDPNVYYAKAYAAFQHGGRQYGLVENFSTVLLFYNKDIFDAKGVPYPTADWTWDDEIAAAQQLTDAKAGVWGVLQPIQFWEFYKVAAQAGGGVVRDGKPAINSPENLAALQYLVDKIHTYKVSPTPEQMGNLQNEDLFEQGKAAMVHIGNWLFPDFKSAPFAWDVVVEPGRTKESKASHFFADAVVISKDSKHPKEAWEWAKFLTSSAEAARIRLDSGWAIPALSDSKLVEVYLQQTAPSNRQAVFDSLLNPVLPPVMPNLQQVIDELNQELDLAELGQKSPADALAAAQKRAEALSQ